MQTVETADGTEIKLGYRVEDKISGMEGIVTTVGDHLSGCTRVAVRPTNVADGQRGSEEFFYPAQLSVISDDPITEPEVTDTEIDVGNVVHNEVTNVEGIAMVVNVSLYNCPSIGIKPVTDDTTDQPDMMWADEPQVTIVDGGVADEYTDLSESPVPTESGHVEDSWDRPDAR